MVMHLHLHIHNLYAYIQLIGFVILKACRSTTIILCWKVREPYVHIHKVLWSCDTMKGVCQTDDLFVCFGAKPDKVFGLDISTRPEVGRERRPVRVGKRNPEKAVDDGRRRVAVGSQHQASERPVAWDKLQQQWGKTSLVAL